MSEADEEAWWRFATCAAKHYGWPEQYRERIPRRRSCSTNTYVSYDPQHLFAPYLGRAEVAWFCAPQFLPHAEYVRLHPWALACFNVLYGALLRDLLMVDEARDVLDEVMQEIRVTPRLRALLAMMVLAAGVG